MPRVDPLIGRALGDRYLILGRLGAGASASVYVAEDDRLGRRVAIKVLHPGLASDESFLRRFQSEARAAARLRHPNLVQVYDWGEDPAGAYVVLEYLAGGSLRQVLDSSGPLELSQVASLGAQAAEGLSHAHQKGTVHRDIKPANLLFDEDGRLAIADFGLARAMADATWTEPAGVILGTARYASPEQATGQATDAATDVYSLALVLVEAVTGTVPFSADTTVATLMARQGRRVDPGPELGPLGPIVAAATDPDPRTRPDSAWLAREIGAVLRNQPPAPAIPLVPPADPLAPARDATNAGGALTGGRAADAPTVVGRAGVGPTGGPGAADDDAAVWATAGVVGTGGGTPDVPAAPAGPGRRRSPRRRTIMLLNLVVIVAVLAGVGIWLALFEFKLATPSHPVPQLVGRTVTAAEQALRSDHFGYHLEAARYDGTVPAGDVAVQSPTPGRTEHQGTVFDLVPSKGPAPRAVPALNGLDQAQVGTRLAAAGFVAHFATAYSETVPTGTVLSWTPRAGQHPKGATVTVTLSAGPRPRVIPRLSGDSYAQAAAALSKVQLDATQALVYSSTVANGQVVSTTPPAGASVARGSPVTVNVSQGPQMVAVPDLVGDSLGEASAALQAAGLVVANVYGPPRGGLVFASDPAAGAQVAVGTGVNLYTE